MNTKWRFYIHRLIEVICIPLCLLKIKNNRIICISHRGGKQYSDSPMYITETLLLDRKYELVWIVDDPRRFSELTQKGIVLVKHRSLKEIFYINTSRVCITNLFGFPPYLVKRKHQLRINTMHGGGAYKSLLSANNSTNNISRYDYLLVNHNINICNLCLSGSRATTQKVYREELGYKGQILEKGLPRNDSVVKIDSSVVSKVKKHYGIEDKVVLVMPTWRRDNDTSNIEINYFDLVNQLEKKYGGEWKVLLRLHHLSQVDISEIVKKYKKILLNATDYPDAQELICAADLLITDYSSVIWDFALKEGPIILYAPDIDEYSKERGFVIPPTDWQLFIARNNEELLKIINECSLDELKETSHKHLMKYGNYESGEATRYVCDYIKQYIHDLGSLGK